MTFFVLTAQLTLTNRQPNNLLTCGHEAVLLEAVVPTKQLLRAWLRTLSNTNTKLYLTMKKWLHCICLTLFSKTTWVSWHRKSKLFWILNFNEARDDEVVVASAGPYANHLHLTAERWPRQYLITQFLQAGCPSCHPANSVKALKALHLEH